MAMRPLWLMLFLPSSLSPLLPSILPSLPSPLLPPTPSHTPVEHSFLTAVGLGWSSPLSPPSSAAEDSLFPLTGGTAPPPQNCPPDWSCHLREDHGLTLTSINSQTCNHISHLGTPLCLPCPVSLVPPHLPPFMYVPPSLILLPNLSLPLPSSHLPSPPPFLPPPPPLPFPPTSPTSLSSLPPAPPPSLRSRKASSTSTLIPFMKSSVQDRGRRR